ncbi:DsbA family protein [Staphylococcus pettenkoferi]|uniref:DsbA family protein n=1 Tax=Staphylococcus pettenkoferi TaxID=170573 RepID=UPI002554726F|nr:thioredoxin domain-containing protein [Staphylococcus pettenkoferi]MDK7284311.1 thioredoxin domain-containing protein [Staphylococcus pettenkoferi]
MKKRPYIFLAITGIALLLIIAISVYKTYHSTDQKKKDSKDPKVILKKQNHFIKKNGYLSEGKNNPIHVVAFTDYRCPHCADYHKNIKKKLLNKYIDNGTIKYTEIQYPVIDKTSKKYEKMALIVQKNTDISSYKDFSDKAYQSSSVDNDPIKTLKRTNISDKKKKHIIESYKNKPFKSKKSNISSKLKVSASPTIFVNGKYISDTNVLEDAIKQEQSK